MPCEAEYTGEFEEWRDSLSKPEQDDIAAMVLLLEEKGTSLTFPYSSALKDQNIVI